MKRAQVLVCVFSYLTGAGILLQWILVWSGRFTVEESLPGYRTDFLSF